MSRPSETWRQRQVMRYFARHGCDAPGPVLVDGHPPLITNEGVIGIGAAVHFRAPQVRTELITTRDGSIRIGASSYVNQGCTIYSCVAVEIGPGCRLGEHVSVHDTDFHAVSPNRPVKRAAVKIGRNVWLGHRVSVLAGVEIGDHSVVGAGSVVTKSLPPRCVAVGTPARAISFFECPDDWHRA